MADWRLSLFQPQIGTEEEEAALRVLRRGWLSAGPEVEALEAEFAAATGSPHAIAVSSCTAALYLSCLTLDLQAGDEIIVPALTWGSTAHAVVHAGGRPVFADCSGPDRPFLDPPDVESRIGPRTRALIVVHYGGFSADLPALLALARRHGLALIEDCAHAPLARGRDPQGNEKYLGCFGRCGCFSFYSAKNMSCGEGGMLLTADPQLADRLRLLRSHGVRRNAWNRRQGTIDAEPLLPGLNFQLDDLRAAIARVQLARLPAANARRRLLAARSRELLSGIPGLKPVLAELPLESAAPHLLPVIPRDDPGMLRARLAAAGIQTGRHYPLLPTTPCYLDPSWQTRWPEMERIFSLPFHAGLGEEELLFLAGQLTSLLT